MAIQDLWQKKFVSQLYPGVNFYIWAVKKKYGETGLCDCGVSVWTCEVSGAQILHELQHVRQNISSLP